jgi:hypothetical protein
MIRKQPAQLRTRVRVSKCLDTDDQMIEWTDSPIDHPIIHLEVINASD